MTKLFSRNFCKIRLYFKTFNSVNFYANYVCQDSPLFLDSPKLISISTRSVSHTIEDLGIKSVVKDIVNIKNSSSTKFEKRYKSITQEQDSQKSKKSKSKYVKSRRTSLENIKDVKIAMGTTDHILNEESIDHASVKSRKSNSKSNKKNKTKHLQGDNNIVYNLTENSQLSPNLDTPMLSEKNVYLNKPLTVAELSKKILVNEVEIIKYLFLNKSVSVTINDLLDIEMLQSIAENYGFNVLKDTTDTNLLSLVNQESTNSISKITRAPIITILGHVDHGKTTLLDSILKTNLVSKEFGGITQAISGYEVIWVNDFKEQKLVFLDTPGHESFKSMRVRGAQVTDIVLLVLAADDGIKPQTIEVIRYVNRMNLSCIVVLTKLDKLTMNIDKIKGDLYDNGLIVEDLGGEVPFVSVNSISGHNIDILLSKICSLSKLKNLVADTDKLAFGMIIESYLDKKKGPVANMIIQNGTLKLAQFLVSDALIGKVKNINSINNNNITSAGPSSIIQVLGFPVVPRAGSSFYSFNKEIEAKKHCSRHSSGSLTSMASSLAKSLNTRVAVNASPNLKKLNLIVKSDTQGSLEAILDILSTISQVKVQINIISASFGGISNADAELALTTNSSIIAFNVNTLPQISRILKKSEINFQIFSIVYDLFEYVKNEMLKLVDTEYEYTFIGSAVVQNVFKTNKGYVAGCLVTEGKLNKNSYIRVYRNNNVQYEGFVTSLKHFKSNVDEALVSTECGLMSVFELWEASDKIEAFKLVAKEKNL